MDKKRGPHLGDRLDELDRRGLGQAETLLRMLCLLPDTPVPRTVLAPDLMAGSELFWGLTARRLDDLIEGLESCGLVNVDARALWLDRETAAAARSGLDQSGQL